MGQTHDFEQFRKITRARRPKGLTPIDSRPIRSRYYDKNEPVANDFTYEEILEIIRSGDLESMRDLSRYYYRTCGEYRNNVDFLAHLPLYDTVVIPIINDKGSKNNHLKGFEQACKFVDNFDAPNTFCRITTEWIKTGEYNGILRTDGEHVTVQDLPLGYCRSRFKDLNNLNILEFNVTYFDSIYDAQLREDTVLTFPKIVQEAYKKWIRGGKKLDPWVMIPAALGGISFFFSNDRTPLLLASIPDLKKLQDSVNREEKRDENELYKLLIQRMPIDKQGELVFQMEEVAEIHASVADMLEDLDTVDVLTTFGDTSLESLQETSAATQSADRINKYKQNAFDALGRSSLIFNADGSSALAYAIKKDEALMISYLNIYETWMKFHLNDRFARAGLSFDFEILPTTVFNRKDLQDAYFRGAQYGYSKMFAGVAMGIKQRDQISLMDFENDYLQMSKKMIPLQSSYTTSGSVINSESSGGRPQLPDEEKSEKTQANIAAAK